ncbi:MAG: hypothetical protein ACE3JP_16110 [Ectobacillus sp.]
MKNTEKERESLIATMDKYNKIMSRVAANRAKPIHRLELKIEGTLYTHLNAEEFLNEFLEWLEKEQQGSKFIGDIKENN